MTVKMYCDLKKRSKTTLELIEKLKIFSHSDDYILGILADSDFDEDRQLIIDYIDKGNNVTYENVILFSLEVGDRREKMLPT